MHGVRETQCCCRAQVSTSRRSRLTTVETKQRLREMVTTGKMWIQHCRVMNVANWDFLVKPVSQYEFLSNRLAGHDTEITNIGGVFSASHGDNAGGLGILGGCEDYYTIRDAA